RRRWPAPARRVASSRSWRPWCQASGRVRVPEAWAGPGSDHRTAPPCSLPGPGPGPRSPATGPGGRSGPCRAWWDGVMVEITTASRLDPATADAVRALGEAARARDGVEALGEQTILSLAG